MNETKELYFYPAASEYRGLTVGQEFTMDADGTTHLQNSWWYEWLGTSDVSGFPTYEAAHQAAIEEGQRRYPGIVLAEGNENAYGAVWQEDTFDR